MKVLTRLFSQLNKGKKAYDRRKPGRTFTAGFLAFIMIFIQIYTDTAIAAGAVTASSYNYGGDGLIEENLLESSVELSDGETDDGGGNDEQYGDPSNTEPAVSKAKSPENNHETEDAKNEGHPQDKVILTELEEEVPAENGEESSHSSEESQNENELFQETEEIQAEAENLAPQECLTGTVTLNVTGSDYQLDVWVPESALIPIDAVLEAAAVNDPWEYRAYSDRAETAMQDALMSDSLLTDVVGLFELSVYDVQGNPVQPADALQVSAFLNLAEDDDVYAVHFLGSGYAGEGAAGYETYETWLPRFTAEHMDVVEVIDAANDIYGAAVFDDDTPAVYAVVRSTYEKTLTADDGTCQVTAMVNGDSGVPYTTELTAGEIPDYTAEYGNYVAATAERLGIDSAAVGFARVFDAALVDSATGNYYQPLNNVIVNVEFPGANLFEFDNVNVVRYYGDQSGSAEILTPAVNGESVTFDTNGFTTFVVVGYNNAESDDASGLEEGSLEEDGPEEPLPSFEAAEGGQGELIDETPAVPEEAEAAGAETPVVPEEAENAGLEEPGTPEEAENAGLEEPGVPEETENAGLEEPEASEETAFPETETPASPENEGLEEPSAETPEATGNGEIIDEENPEYAAPEGAENVPEENAGISDAEGAEQAPGEDSADQDAGDASEEAIISDGSESAPGQESDVPVETENISGQESDVPVETENISGQESDAPGESENVPGQDSDVPDESENAPGHESDVHDESENAPGHESDVPDESENASGQNSDVLDEEEMILTDIAAQCERVDNSTAYQLAEEYLPQPTLAEGEPGVVRYAAFDISFTNTEAQYAQESLRVEIELPEDIIGRDLLLYAINGDHAAEAVDVNAENGILSFAAPISGIYVLQYTADLQWGEYTYGLVGDDREGISLSALLENLSITKIDLDDIVNVSFADEELLTAEKAGQDWMLYPLAPFGSYDPLHLTLSLRGGNHVSIGLRNIYPAQSFVGSTAGVNVSVEAPEGAFPENSYMEVKRVWDRDTLSEIRDAVSEDFVQVHRVQAVDITFYDVYGTEIEPLLPISVVMSVSGMKPEQNAVVVHLDDEGALDVQDAEVTNPDSGTMDLTFDAEAFSTYAVVVTETLEARYIDAAGNTYAVEVSYGPEAGIPAGAELSVSELTGDEGEQYTSQAAEALEVIPEQVSYAKALDISIIADGQPIQPGSPVSVSIRLLDAPDASENTNINVLHFGNEVESIPCALEDETVVFEADGFSVYVVVCTTLRQTLTASDNNEYLVTVTYDHASGIPSDAELYVSEIKEGEAGYDEYVAQSAAALGKNPENLAFARPFDITLKNPQTGEEYQPNEAVQVSIQLLKDSLNNYANVDVVHIPDGTGETAQVMDTTVHGEAVEFAADGFSVYVLTAINAPENEGETTTASCALTIGESTPLSDILSALNINVVNVEAASTEATNLTVEPGTDEQSADWVVILSSTDTAILHLTLNDNSKVDITVKPLVTVTAVNASKTYGETDPEGFTATVAGLVGEDTIAYSLSRVEGENVGEYAIMPSGDAVQGNYTVKYVAGALTIIPKTLTITAGTETKQYTGSSLSLDADSYTSTELAAGDSIESVTFSDEQTYMGTYAIVASSAVIKNAAGEDVSANYDITYVDGSLTITWPDDMLQKELTAFNGDLATYKITVNPEACVLTEDGSSLVLKDTFSNNQSINYGSIIAASSTGEDVTYDFSGNTGTYTIPDGSTVTITYTTRVKGQVGRPSTFNNIAVLGRMEEGSFVAGPTVAVNETKTISPTGSDISGTGGVYSIDLFAYAEGHMEQGLEGAVFRLLDSNMRPMAYATGEHSGEQITFTTGTNGYVTIALSSEEDGLSIHKNTVYFLEMVDAPYQIVGGEYVYYQKDNTFYSFLITDDPNYTYGGIYSYYNGDVLKVRCYPEAKGINITKRFSGNYTLTDEQKNAIRFVLQKEALGTASGWVDVESHTYAEFSYGSINFNIGREGGTELEDFATYRVIEENALPTELDGMIDENVSVSVSYQQGGVPVTDDSNEFFVDPDDKLAFSYDFAFTNEYVDHKLTIIKIDENTGTALPGAIFSVYAISNDQEPVATYTADDSGSIIIRKGDEADYAVDTLYYVVESEAPQGYFIPGNPQKTYFYFSENGSSVPDGVPAGVTATDLTSSFNTVTLSNNGNNVNIPVTVVWGVNGDDTWPTDVSCVVVGLYKSVAGATAEPVMDEDNQPRTLELTKEQYYDTTTFVGLPAQENGKTIAYSVQEEHVYAGDTDIIKQYANSSSISGTGWYVVNNQAAISLLIQKEWHDLNGAVLSDTTGKPDVTFALYRTTTRSEETSFTRDELVAFLTGAVRVRSGLTLSAGSWSTTIDSLQKTDKQGNTYYYYALEDIPDNQEDSYTITAATETEPRTLTISNKQTPVTVTIKVNDLTRTYGDSNTGYTFEASVKEDGASIIITGPDDDGKYTAKVTAANGTVSEIEFTISGDSSENAGVYVVTPSGEALQAGYRVLYESGTLTINRAEVIITAGAEKVYGETDPLLVKVEGLKNDEDPSVLTYTVTREEGEDVGTYPITLTGNSVQGNYVVTYDRTNAVLTITPAQAKVKAVNASKLYGDDDPVFAADITGLEFSDEPTTISYDLMREAGENIGTYPIAATGETRQGNYNVTYEGAEFTITSAPLTVKVEDAEKSYGDSDPEWEVSIDGLQRNEDSGTLGSVLNEETGVRSYTYTVGEGEDEKTLLTFTVSRPKNENVGEYTVTPSGAETQGNYTLTFGEGSLSILRAELIVTPNRIVKAIGLVEDPLLTATVTGWKGGDEEATAAYEIGKDDNAGLITWTYMIGDTTLLTFTLKRDAGEDEGEYPITASGEQNQSNYVVDYEPGTFGILAILDIDVTQPLVDHADADANPEYTYTATLDLAGTGLTEYEKNGFELVDGVLTQTFTLPAEDNSSIKTLKIPVGAKLSVRQDTTNADYTTTIRMDGVAYANPEDALSCRIDSVETYHEIAFAHSRISLPVIARAAVSQAEEGAVPLAGREGAMGIPDEDSEIIDADFADEMHSKIGYILPSDMYYAYNHASLYTKAGVAIDGAANVTEVIYDTENAKWRYRTDGEFVDVPAESQLVLFYLPKFVCKIGTEKFYSLKKAVEYAEENTKTATIEMLIGEYSIRSNADAVTIPSDCIITITTAETEYEGTGNAVISRSMSYADGHLFKNDGTLILGDIILDGKGIQSTDAIILNETADAVLTVNTGATVQNANGNNGGAIYVKTGIVTVNGTLLDNSATYGGAVYVNSGTVTLGGDLSGNSATSGGTVYVNAGEVEINGTVSGNSATSGGAVYLVKGVNNQDSILTVSGSLKDNEAVNGGAVYQASGTLTVSGSLSGNTASSNGAAVYLAGGTIDVEANGSLSGNTASSNGGAVYQAGGTLINVGIISGNKAANGGGIYRVNGTLTVGGTLSGNVANENGGGVYTVVGTVNVTGILGGTEAGAGNSAANGGAIYSSGTTLNLNGARFTQNTATANGGAIFALNANTVIGGAWSNNAATEGTAASFNGNTAVGNGGAMYMEGGSVTLMNASSALNANTAANGGAIYATSGAITMENGKLESNEANTSGGAIYSDSASVTVKGGTLGGTGKGNAAKQGDGGAIYAVSGAVTVSGGTLAGNSASEGNGGAVYAGTGTVNYTAGNINGGNSAVNGAAIYVGSGIANVSASITGNTATNGGAIGVGGTSARLYFKSNAEVNDNTMNGAQSNVYLDVDSELVINADSLGNSKKIGIYVPGDVDSDQVVKHGDVTGYFGAYVSAGTLTNMPNVFKSDRFSDLKVAYENNRLYWINSLTYDIYYLKNYDAQFPPTANYTATPSKKVCTYKTYAPRTRESDIYDLVMAMKLYEAHNNDFTNNVGANYASSAVYAYTFSDKAMGNNFKNYLKTVRWNAAGRRWDYVKQDGEIAPADTAKLVIFYSAPAYLTIVNNNDSNLELDISELTVLGRDAGDGVYGFVTAKNGATVATLRTLTADDLKLDAGESIKLMFPGAQGQKFALKGTFTGEGAGESTSVTYSFNGGTEQTITGTSVDFSGDGFKLNSSDEAAEIIFGDALPICKIGNEPFSTLKAAMAYAVAQKAATGSTTYKIEMLVDYLVPKDDVLEIPAGYDITFTTASKDDETLPYTGNGTRATLSRDTGNTGSSVSAKNSILTVNNLSFDGRSLTAGGKGGAVSAESCATVTIINCEFKGYRADNGGAVYVNNTAAGSKLTVEGCQFSNCQTNASVDKAGGGGVWTTARELYVQNCTFDSCACLKGSAQAGSIFHNIQSGWSANSVTEISDCTFSNSYSVGGSGGSVESDALDVTIQRCSFEGSYTNKSGGSGGAVNTYANNAASTGTYCIMRVIDCTFDNCSAKNGGAMGGAVRCSTHDLILRGCIFRNTQGVTGGAVAMTNSNAKKVEIYGCIFDNCTATGNGGAVSAPAGTLIVGVEDSQLEDYRSTYLDNTAKDGNNYFTDCTANRGGGIDNPTNDASVTMENVSFTRCVARTSNGGALYTQAKTLSITGESNSFTDCTGYGSGGAVFQNRNVDGSKVELENCVFSGCEAFNNGNGGGMYANARTLAINYDTVNNSAIEAAEGSFKNCTAANAGGGLYHDYAGTVNIANCGFDDCKAKASYGGGLYTSAHTLSITGAGSKFKDCTAQTDGGGLYHNRDASGSTFTFKDGSFDNCTATGNYGGAIYTKAKGVILESCAVKGSTAKAQGGGVYINPSSARFDGCTITGNSVTNSDSKGGGVYVPGGTTTFTNNTVSGCEAANGGGWYQNNGNLYILGGSISGSATNGGGLYMYDSNTKVYHYGGTVAGTATANGGGVYKNNGAYTLGNGTYNGVEYTSGASIGGRIDLPVIVNAEETTKTVDTSAVNGGGVYQASGNLTMNTGASIGSVETGETGETVYTATATGNGGGIYLGGGWVKILGGVITNCQAAGNGGGIYHTSTGNSNDLYFYGADATAKIQNCVATNGGGVYVNSNTFHMGENGKTSLGTIENCRASNNGGGVYVAGGTFNLRNTSAIKDCIANVDGGGVYQAGGTFNQSNTSSVADCKASNNGGGMYHAGGTLAFSGGSVIRNSATVNGGGVYHAGGTFSMTNASAVIGGTEENANTANMGAGAFVADGQAATFNGSTVTYNRAVNAGGGIAIGGPDAVLTFQGTVTVRHNTMGSQNTACNVYLDQNRNTVIRNNALNTGAYIGVYASDEQDAEHGQPGKPFGTYNGSNTGNLNVYHNDRRQYLYGMKGSSNNEVIWPEFVCKITDGEGNLLYKDDSGTPAVYSDLENIIGDNSATNSASAFAALNTAGTPALYLKIDAEQYSLYDGNEYQIQMLVQDYELGSKKQLKLDKNVARKVTLTTASAVEDECGFKYTGDARFAASITRTADTWAMLYVGGTSGWDLTLSNITLDGNEHTANEAGAIMRIYGNAKVTLGDGATLRKGVSTSSNNSVLGGGAVYIHEANGKLVMDAGSKIENSSAGTKNGGGVYLNNGTLIMNGGTISGCFATNGGGVYLTNSGRIEMKGGEITGNNATSQGGGIAINGASASTSFSGYCIVTGNTLNGTTRCNAQFNHDSNTHIYANGLDTRSEIGIYTADSGNNKIYTNHGESGDPFGTWNINEDNLFCFVNDRHTDYRGFQSTNASDTRIFWEYHPLLTVTKVVSSDWSADQDVEFGFTVKLNGEGLFPSTHNVYGGMDFNKQGVATFTLKAGQSVTAILPDTFDKVNYEVAEVLSEEQAADYTTVATKDGETFAFAEDKPMTVSGQLGENIGTTNSTSLSVAAFTNARVTGELTVSKRVVSNFEQDFQDAFNFKLALDDTSINKAYTIVKKDASGNTTSGELTFTKGVAVFTQKHGESLTIQGLPTDLKYSVEEVLDDSQKTTVRTTVSKDSAEAVSAIKQEGIIGEKYITETIGDEERTVYTSEVVFENTFLEIVCKITNRSRELLYIRESNGNLSEAVFAHLEDAFAQINSGNLRTSRNGTVSGTLRIEMVVPSYTMEGTATLSSGRTVILSTALTTDEDNFPYNKGQDDGNGNISIVSRGFSDGSMIEDSGVLTIDKILLDGAAGIDEPILGNADGGIVKVTGAVRLTVNSVAALQNSTVTGNGGAVYLSSGASLAMNGTISSCVAANGGGIYAATGFSAVTTTGEIANCEADGGNGGAIAASTGGNVNLNAGTTLTGNEASSSGGAVYSEANVVLRGTIGGTLAGKGNSADVNGGGICMGENAMFTMYSGSVIVGNRADNGGGLAVQSSARIAGGTIESNSATSNGGAIYASDSANVTISGSPIITGNEAKQGGAVYNGNSVTVTGGSITDNTATEKGGAVYVVGGKTFTMSGGNIREGNKSPEGAVSTGASAVLVFSGNAIVSGNTDSTGTIPMNVFLGYDSNSIITTSGLGTSADIGVYVVDGEPEDESVPDAVSNPIYSDHGLSARNFGTYTGSNVSGARLNRFVNDRDTILTGMGGAEITGSNFNYITWDGKGLRLKVSKVDSEGTSTVASGISFTLTNSSGVQVWSGRSAVDGLVSIPWGPEERANGNVATFAPKSSYTLRQTAANTDTVLPAGTWTVTIARDNAVTWVAVPSEEESVDRTLEITSSKAPGEKAYLGETFGVSNDVKPTLTYHATGGKLSDNQGERTDTIGFTTTETSHKYTIRETNPTWDSHVFKNWATLETKPTAEDGSELSDSELIEKGYFEYEQNGEIVFFRGMDEDDNTQGYSKGDLTLYAQWDEVVCKITDRNGTILYINGSPAVYGSLEDGFAAYNAANAYSFTYANGSRGTARMIEMLIPAYTLEGPVTVERGKTVMLTTAPTTDTDGYAYTGEEGTVCVITRGETCDSSMVENKSNLTLMNVALDGGAGENTVPVVCDGGIINNAQTSAVLSIADGAILRNSKITGNGAAVNAIAGTTVYFTGGSITDNNCVETGNGAGIYLAEGATLRLSGSPSFSNNLSETTLPANAKNGGEDYTAARQDIYLAGVASEGEALTSITLTGNLADTVPAGSIWVWAEGDDNTQPNHYYMLKQFAVVSFTGDVSDATYNAFRNARADSDTDCGGEYLRGQSGDNIGSTKCIYWTGGFDFSFLKVNGFGEPLPRATFTLYTAYTSATDNTPYQKGGEGVTATSSDGENATAYPDPEDSSKAQPEGTVLFSKIAPKDYYMVETTTPEGYVGNTDEATTVYKVTIGSDGTATLMRKLLSEEDTAYQEVYKVETQAATEATATEPAKPAVYQYCVMNISTAERKAILRKIEEGTYKPLPNAVFEILRYDRTKVSSTDINGDTVTTFTSGDSGVYFIDKLPFGVYYLHETTIPSGYSKTTSGDDGNWFILTVNDKGVGYQTEDLKVINTLSPETTAPD